MGKFFKGFFILVFVLIVGGCFMSLAGMISVFSPPEVKLSQDSILHLEIEGVIIDGKDFLEHIRKYAKEKSVKGVLIQINSPGGVVGPSQEIYSEIKRVRDELNKPVVVSTSALAASGGYYAAVGASKIVTNPGTLMGSIGVIMGFANLERLYDWAKIQRYSIKTGTFKDSGADYRAMTDEEKQFFQGMLAQVLEQFKKAIVEGRKLSPELVAEYADGRIFVGEEAVRLGFADQVGTFEDARRLVGELSGLGSDPKLYFPKKKTDFFTMLEEASMEGRLQDLFEKTSQLKLFGQPLYIMPGIL